MASTEHPSPSLRTPPTPGTSFSVCLDEADGCITVAGELELETAPVFAGVIAGQVAHRRVDVRLDLSDVTFFDLPGFDALCAAQRHLEERGGRLRIVAASHLLRVVADLLGHESLFESAPVLLAPSAGPPRVTSAGPADG